MRKALLLLLGALLATPLLMAQNPQVRRVGTLAKEVEGTSTLFVLDGRLWTCNDHGRLRLYALDTLTGKVTTTVDLKVTVYDLEEVTQDDRYLYFGDFGDNNGVRNDLRILRLAKGDFRKGRYRFDTIAFSYPDRASGTRARDFDCEAFAAVGDSLYLFTKQWVSQGSTCYALPKTPGRYKARRCQSFDTRGLVTAATYLPGSRQLVLLGYTLMVRPFVVVVDGFGDSRRLHERRMLLNLPLGTQSEGIATADGRHFFLSSEFLSLGFFSCQGALFRLNLSGYSSSR